jgi:hypothetical protein
MSNRSRVLRTLIPAARLVRRHLGLVTLDVDAPVGAVAGTQHADRARLLVEGDHAPGPGHRGLLDIGIHHRPQVLGGRKIVLNMVDSVTHIPFQRPYPGNVRLSSSDHHLEDGRHGDVRQGERDEDLPGDLCSWSSRKRGKVQRNQIMAKISRKTLATRMSGPRTTNWSSLRPGSQ